MTVSGGQIFHSTNVQFDVKGGVADVVEGATAIIMIMLVATTAVEVVELPLLEFLEIPGK